MDTYTACQGLAEQLDAAVEEDDAEAVAAMQQQLQQLQQQVEAGIRAAKPPANVRRWLQVRTLHCNMLTGNNTSTRQVADSMRACSC
jgi:hypothetical protein